MTPGPFAGLISDDLGRIIARDNGRYDVVFERRIARPVEKVWAALTIPERIADWFTEAELDLRVGGHYRLSFAWENYAISGVIIELEPLRRLTHTWPDKEHPDSVVRYELEPDGEGCRLTLTQTALGRTHFDVLPGWHTFLEALPGAADGVRTPWSPERDRATAERYRHIVDALPEPTGA